MLSGYIAFLPFPRNGGEALKADFFCVCGCCSVLGVLLGQGQSCTSYGPTRSLVAQGLSDISLTFEVVVRCDALLSCEPFPQYCSTSS